MAEQIEIDASQFVSFYKAVSKIDPELKKALRKQLLSKTEPIVNDVRQAALSIPASREAGMTRKKKGVSLGLRASIASSVKSDFNGTGNGAVVNIRVSRTRFMAVSGKAGSLPARMEGRGRWRHPVFGNKNVWVQQKSHPFLWTTVMKHQQEFIDAVSSSVDETMQALDSVIGKAE